MEDDEDSTASTLQTNNEDAFIKVRPPRRKREKDGKNEKDRKDGQDGKDGRDGRDGKYGKEAREGMLGNYREGKEHVHPLGVEYVQEEFFWIVDYRGTEKIFDSDAFTFAGQCEECSCHLQSTLSSMLSKEC